MTQKSSNANSHRTSKRGVSACAGGMHITALAAMAWLFMPGANHGNKISGQRVSCLNRFLVNLGRGHELSTYLCRSAVGLQKQGE